MKQIFTLSIFLLATVLSFAQGKGKDKAKGKQKTEVKSTVPAPTGHTTKPEVDTKQKPQIYQKADTTKNGNATNPSAASESQSGNNNASTGTQSGGQTQTTTATGESVLGQSSNSGAQPQSGKNNSTASGQTSAESNNTPVGSNQGESTKGVGKQKDKLKNNQNGNGNSKNRANIPTQVRNSFNADYPYAVNDVWKKNRGDWTVTFGHGIWNSIATYHSNGERVDTRTPVRRDQTPRPVQDEIFKRFPQTNPKDIIKIEKPKNPNLFQVVVEQAGIMKTLVFDEKGKLISQQ